MKFFLLFMTIVIFIPNTYADDITGEKVYAKKIKQMCGFKGDEFAKKYTKKQWATIYKQKGRFNRTLQKHCPNILPLKEEHIEHLYEFFYKYAKDSGKKPLC